MIDKKISPKGKSVRVTFELPADIAAESVAIVGDFNDWDSEEHQMTLKKKKGVWTRSVSFKPGERHEFRYLVDGHRWVNDESADGYRPNTFLSDNCVLEV